LGLRLVDLIDGLSERLGQAVSWLALAMVLVGAYNAIVRYLGRFAGWNLSSNAYIEAQWYMFSALFLLGASYTLKHDRHVRVDVFYGRLSPRGKARLDLVGTLVFLVPFSVFCLWVSWPSVRNSWSVMEISPDPGGLPRYPIKSLILVSWSLVLLQGLAEAFRNAARLTGALPLDEPAGQHDNPEQP
jgi:TRAP-type mannitol/chloroaromatic compound transport system permease small subunit